MCSVLKKLILIFVTNVPLIAFAQLPGAVSSGLYLWLKADVGVSVTGQNVSQWTNLATNPMTMQASKTPTANVKLDPSAFNYNPTLVYDGTSNQMLQGQYTTAPNSQPLAFVVANKNGTSVAACCNNPFSLSPQGAPGIDYGPLDAYQVDGHGLDCSASPAAVNTPAVVRVNYPTANTMLGASLGFNGSVYSSCPANPVDNPDGIFQVGGRTYGSLPNRIYKGNIAEVIHYNTTTISNAQIHQIESYLAVKYGLTLAIDYVNSAGSVVYATDPVYRYKIIGLGRDDNTALLQKQSHQYNDSTRLYLSSLAESNAVNSSTFASDNQYLIMGNNNLPLRSTGSTVFPAGLGIYSRISREWKITNTNFGGTFSIDVSLNTTPITASDLRILITNDGNFMHATMYNPAISYAAGVVTISGLSTSLFPINGTAYMTIVSLASNTPLPVSLTDLKAVYNKSTCYVDLSWQTITENNNDFFTIEKSLDGKIFLPFSIVKSKGIYGNSKVMLNYIEKDILPSTGVSYYRLMQTDVDGYEYYFNHISVQVDALQNIGFYPNPVNHKNDLYMSAIGYQNQQAFITCKDIIGRLLFSKTIPIEENNQVFILEEMKSAAPGIYLITVSAENKIYNYKIIID